MGIFSVGDVIVLGMGTSIRIGNILGMVAVQGIATNPKSCDYPWYSYNPRDVNHVNANYHPRVTVCQDLRLMHGLV